MCHCSHFLYKSDTVSNTNVCAFANNKNLHINISGITTLADFKTWLSTHNTTVEYELAEEEITPYTSEQQTAWEQIKQLKSYYEQTNISGSSDEVSPIFEVTALK